MKSILLAVAISCSALCAQGQSAASVQGQILAEDPHITKMLVGAQVGDLLRKTCPQVEARMFVVVSEMFALERYAKDLGQTDAQIKAFLKNPKEKARIRALANAYLQQAGATAGDSESHCRVARAEVAAQTVAGSLISVAP